MRAIARALGRSPSTISRELRRNASMRGGDFVYRATIAQRHADRAALRPKVARLVTQPLLRTYVEERLAGLVVTSTGVELVGPQVAWKGRRRGRRQARRWARAWSPEQIAQCLPRARVAGRGKSFVTSDGMISMRPPDIEDRAVPWHWEGDLILGEHSSAIGTLVERTTRFTMLLHHRCLGTVSRCVQSMAPHSRVMGPPPCVAIGRAIATLPEHLRQSLTWDQGAEMAQHAQLRLDSGLQIYCCDPHSPWQRGTNENTNGLLRQDFPKGTNLGTVTDTDLNAVALALNSRPRKTLDWPPPPKH